MKQIISKFKKCLCLTLSIFLLAPNMQVFAQEVPYCDILIHYFNEFPIELNELENSLSAMSTKMKDPQAYLHKVAFTGGEGGFGVAIENEAFKKIVSKYKEIRNNYHKYIDIYNTVTEKGVLPILSREYSSDITLARKLSKKKIATFPNEIIHSISLPQNEYPFPFKVTLTFKLRERTLSYAYYMEQTDVDKIRNAIKYMQDNIKEMRESIKLIEKAKAELVRQTYTPIDIMEYAYKNGMLPKEKASIKLTLETMDADVSVNSLVKSIRQYLTDFGTKIKDVKYYPEESLMRELEGMTLAERTKYVDELTELQSGSKEFIKDFKKLDRPAKRYIGKNIINGTWATVGIMVGLTLLFELIPQNSNANNINKSLEIMDALDDIAYKIENGEATMPEMLYFYTIPENESLILNDPVHTLNFVKLAQGAMEAEEILSKAEEENKAQKSKQVENSIMKNYQKQARKTDFGVGTL